MSELQKKGSTLNIWVRIFFLVQNFLCNCNLRLEPISYLPLTILRVHWITVHIINVHFNTLINGQKNVLQNTINYKKNALISKYYLASFREEYIKTSVKKVLRVSAPCSLTDSVSAVLMPQNRFQKNFVGFFPILPWEKPNKFFVFAK